MDCQDKIQKLKEQLEKTNQISRASHFQAKGRLSNLEKRLSVLEKNEEEFKKNADIDEVIERIENIERGLKNLWSCYKKNAS